MLFLLAVPVIATVAFAYRVVQQVAPSNMLIAIVRSRLPTIRSACALATLALALIAVAHAIDIAIAQGAPGGLNLIVGLLLWDAIKFLMLALAIVARWIRATVIKQASSPRSDRSNPRGQLFVSEG